jgi:hypothetical protein
MVIDEHFNMSDLAHFATYLNRGGMQGPDRSFLFAGVRVLNMVENSH